MNALQTAPSLNTLTTVKAQHTVVPDLTIYDFILLNSSAGKDSQVAIDEAVKQAKLQGVPMERLIVVHADLGRVEWKGTKDLARRQAEHYGLRFEVVENTREDLLDHIERRGKFPDAANRFCTSDHKTGPVFKLITALADGRREEFRKLYALENGIPYEKVKIKDLQRPRILNVLGIRADELPARAKYVPFERGDDLVQNTKGAWVRQFETTSRKSVDRWLPVFGWDVDDVWARIRESGVPYHAAYDYGMPRLSCCFCVFASAPALRLAGHHNPELLDQYVQVEKRIGHTFRHKLPLAMIQADLAKEGYKPEPVQNWTM